MYKQISFLLVGFLVLLSPLGTTTIFTNALASNDEEKGYKSYDRDDYKKSKNTIVNENNNCINNNNINVNTIGNSDIGSSSDLVATEEDGIEKEAYPNIYGTNEDRNNNNKQNDKSVSCIINNNNVISTGGESIPPTTPTTPASLTVKKQVFGCDNFQGSLMNCRALQNNSPFWLNCNDDSIDHSIFCLSLPESIFDIRVLDNQMRQIQKFKGSEQGTTIENLGPGLYRVNEIKYVISFDHLRNNPAAKAECVNEGRFSDGGDSFNTTSHVDYIAICFEYKDEQGNNCSTISLAAGEEKTCIVKNYIRIASHR
jgi:hypothetical protein